MIMGGCHPRLVRDSSSGWLGLDWIRQPRAIKKSPSDLAGSTSGMRKRSDAILRNGATIALAHGQ